MDALLGAAQWVVGKALAPIADGVLEAWEASNNLGLNIETLKMELLLVKATLELASGKQIHGQAMELLLGKLRDSAHCAEDLLDELDYFRIHDQLQGTYDAADQHGKGGVHDIALNACHVAKAVGKLSFISSFCCSAPSPAGDSREVDGAIQRARCCACPRAMQRTTGNSSSAPNANREVSSCMPKLGKLLPCLSSPQVRQDRSGQPTLCGAPQGETPMPQFNRAHVSERMRHIVEQLQPVRKEVTQILQSCNPMTVPDIAQSRPITTSQSIEPNLYGRDRIMHTIIHDMTKGKYLSNDLTVLPIVGPGGIGKTTLIQHIYRNQQVQNHFQVVIWVCVSLSFNLKKLLEEIKTYIPRVEGEKDGRVEELIEQRLKSKRFLLVLDDIWEFSDGDDWKRLLLPLKTSQEKGSIILVTTRFPKITKMVGTTRHIELQGLESEEFRMLFLAFVFGNEPVRSDQCFLDEIGNKIMEKLRGSPLAAKTVGALLSKDLSLQHWRRVLESKEWETQTDSNGIMPALKLSYDHLSFQQQQCFFFSALFPEDHKYSATQLINLWIGLGILQPGARNQTLEIIGSNNLNDLVACGFFREEEEDGYPRYVMHDLLHDLALQVASHECLVVHHSSVRLEEIHPSIRHLSIIIHDADKISLENLKSELRKLKTSLKVKQLHTLMLFGEMDESFVSILGDLLGEAKSLRVLRLDDMPFSVESILHNFSTLLHLRYLYLGTECEREMNVLLTVSRFYHLRILALGSWCQNCHLPKELSNLVNMRHVYTPTVELHSDIFNVGKLRHLEELKVFRVNKESEGFELKQLEHLTELREVGIYNLENIHTKEEANKANLGVKNYLERLTLDWDSKRSNIEPDVEEIVLESLMPQRYLQDLCVRGHGGSSCPTWLGDKLAVEVLESLHLSGVSWEHLPPLGKMRGLVKVILENIATIEEFVIDQSSCRLVRLELVGLESFEKWVLSEGVDHMFPHLQVMIIRGCPKLLELPFQNCFFDPKPDQDQNICWFPKLQKLQIHKCPKLLLVARIPWTGTLQSVKIGDVRLLEKFRYSTSSYNGVDLEIVGKDELQSLDEVVAFNNLTGLEYLTLIKCPPMESKHLLLLTSLKKLDVQGSDDPVGPVGGGGDVDWQYPLEFLEVQKSCGGKQLTQLLTHLPRLSSLRIMDCEDITQLAAATTTEMELWKVDDDSGILLLPGHLSDTLQSLVIHGCLELVLVDSIRAGGGLQALQSLQTLSIFNSPKLLSTTRSSFSSCLFPSSLHRLILESLNGMETLEPLSNLTSLTKLHVKFCGEDLRCKGLGSLLTTGEQLRELTIFGSPKFFTGWDHNPRRVQLQGGGGEELVSPQSSSKLQMISTDEAMGLLAEPICSFLSSSLTELYLYGSRQEMEYFTKEQEDALQLLASLQRLHIYWYSKLQHLPARLHKLTNLKKLLVGYCPAVRSLPKDGLPKLLQELDVRDCGNEELKNECRGLVGTIPRIKLA
uniref:AAA+ ATPase domain-containing protein n=1 Tax=Hordeum vulgare subsp. vulgare TaxID=112509 RepID=A0A8I7BFV3_HORVV